MSHSSSSLEGLTGSTLFWPVRTCCVGVQRGRGGVSQPGMEGFSIGQFKRDPETHFHKICKKRKKRKRKKRKKKKTEAQQNCDYNFVYTEYAVFNVTLRDSFMRLSIRKKYNAFCAIVFQFIPKMQLQITVWNSVQLF